ncbi:hypothetical protein VTP01DRAFT_9144 [Rhizomucor pusillus]|uniref:uncharacterized protein n=1 Tax=Rhizomucor pusillus TaxID=4840 RepID=UPI003742692C
MVELNRDLLVLFGSETGSAEDVAERIGRQARKRRFRTRVVAMDEYGQEQLSHEKLVIFVCSTTGQGIEPYNMKRFWRYLLRKSLSPDLLANTDCAVFGLGDSSYAKFNYPAKKLYRRLQQLGARMIHTRGDGDDQHYLGLDGALDPWLKAVWSEIDQKYPLPEGVEVIPDDELLPPTFRIEFISSDQPVQTSNNSIHQGIDMVVESNDRITAQDHFQDVRHLVLTTDSQELSYECGDVAVLTPKNLPQEIDLFLEAMGWTDLGPKPIKIVPVSEDRKVPAHWRSDMTFRDLFIDILDVFGVPRRSFFEMLAYFTKDENQRERLREFASPEGQDDMYNYCQRPRRTVAEILFDFRSADIPLDYILDVFPFIRPRSFSIASSLQKHPGKIELCVAIVKYKTKLKRIRRGVCTKWISQLKPGDVVHGVRISSGTMRLPPSPSIPMIAIGPGTGVAPMRSFIEQRILEGAKDNVLFFGCRYKEKDYHYQKEWEDYAASGDLRIFTAFSREQEEKLYVQDRIRENGALIWKLVNEQQAKIVLSGSSNKMPQQVAYAFKQVFMEHGGLDAEQAENYWSIMMKTGQYQEECWS